MLESIVQDPQERPRKVYADVETLKAGLPEHLRQIQDLRGTKHLVVNLPYKPIVTSLQAGPSSSWYRPWAWVSGRKEKTHDSSHPVCAAPVVIVDTPGLGGRFKNMRQHIEHILLSKNFVACFMVPMIDPKSLGESGLQLAEFLTKMVQSESMKVGKVPKDFPFVIIFSKWEEFKRTTACPRWRRQHFRGKSMEDVTVQKLCELFEDLRGNGLRPYFASANSLDALDDPSDKDVDRAVVEQAKKSIKSLTTALFRMGTSAAAPLQHCRLLEVLDRDVQAIINVTLTSLP